jgi:hypothetical protein
VAVRKWRADVIEDLGGKDAISTQQETLIDLASKSKLLLDSVDAWLMTQPSLKALAHSCRSSTAKLGKIAS